MSNKNRKDIHLIINQAIESAQCRIYRLRANNSSSNTLAHQEKAKNQEELMKVTIEALKYYKEKIMEEEQMYDDDNEYSKCNFCKRLASYCSECSNYDLYVPYTDAIIHKADVEGLSVCDVIALMNLG